IPGVIEPLLTPPLYDEPFGQPVPTQIQNLKDITAISLIHRHTLGLKRDGTVWAWGLNDCNQLGVPDLPNKAPFTTTPLQVPGLSDVIAVAAGRRHSLVLKADGTVWSWGQNIDFETNYGGCRDPGDTPYTRQYRSVIRPVKLPGKVVAIAASAESSMALLSDGTVWIWGQKR
ncbi:MAG: hypothetical protein V4525_02265, partial [Pseudomonadota bacterium]